MSIASEIQRLQQAKANLKTVLGNKGATIPSDATLDTYSTYAQQIPIEGLIQRDITSIVIPDSVTSIGDYAFYNYHNLSNCTIGSGVTSIGNNAFAYCSVLTSIVIPDSVITIGSYAFTLCKSLTSCTIGSGVTSIGEGAFASCTGLTSIDIPDSVTSIGGGVFSSCSILTSCTIGSGVTSIGDNAFYLCSSLRSITCNATTAPTIYSSTFQDIKTGGTLYVPNGSSGYDVWMGTSNYYLGKYNWTKVEQ